MDSMEKITAIINRVTGTDVKYIKSGVQLYKELNISSIQMLTIVTDMVTEFGLDVNKILESFDFTAIQCLEDLVAITRFV